MRPNSQALDAHIKADHALVRGWRAKASHILLKAALLQPGRDDLRFRVLELDALSDEEVQQFTSKANFLWSAAHFFMGFMVQVALLAGTLAFGLRLPSSLLLGYTVEGLAQNLVLVAICAGYSVLSVLLWSRLYLALWFNYLWWVPRCQAPNAASWLGFYSTYWQFSNAFWLRKKKFYLERYRRS